MTPPEPIPVSPSIAARIRDAYGELVRRLCDAAPALMHVLQPWMEGRAARGIAAEHYFTHPLAFPLLRLPFWVEESAGRTCGDDTHREILVSSMSGYYAIRLLDDVMDGAADAAPKLLPASLVFASCFQDAYARLFPPTHAFWTTFASRWAACHEGAILEAIGGVADEDGFNRTSAQKTGSAILPMQAVAWRCLDADLAPAWQDALALLCRFHQRHNDLFDWQRDLGAGTPTFFLAQAALRARPGESVAAWVAREGFADEAAWVGEALDALAVAAGRLGSPSFAAWVEHRQAMFCATVSDARDGLRALAVILAAVEARSPLPATAKPEEPGDDPTPQSPLLGLFDEAMTLFESLRSELAAYGLLIPPELRVLRGEGLLCCYDLSDGNIYLSLPEPSTPMGVFQAAVFKSVMACSDDAELATLIRLLLPGLIAHELGHYFRHATGRFGADLWFEEQVANQFAAACTERLMNPDDRRRLIGLLRRTITHLAPTVGSEGIAVATYLDPLQALAASGLLARSEVRGLEVMGDLFTVSSEDVLRAAPLLSPEASRHLQSRQGTIDGFNEAYSASIARYVYFQLGWMLIELESPEMAYVDDVACRHFGRARALLPLIPAGAPATDDQIRACFVASRSVPAPQHAVRKYFFKRYRSLLLGRLAVWLESERGRSLHGASRQLLEASQEDAATLDWLAVLAPAELEALLPAALATDSLLAEVEPTFGCETDTRIWRWVSQGLRDPAAAATIARLDHLDHSGVFSALSAELLIELTHAFFEVRVPAGRVIIWQESLNDDVFTLVSGALEVIVSDASGVRRVAMVAPGEMVGDMAFFSGAPRTATLRATEPSVALVLRSAALRKLAFEHPALPLQMARLLARRLSGFIVPSG